ncbi:hypothetical protein CBS115989_7489 [Aspergillus niger]|nr:hypothetical protein CBS115989_7489 [Aspergillus niger]
MSAAAMSKKNKGKKVADPNETSKLLAAKISQLEQDAAGEKDQEAEIEREVKKATRDLNQLLSNIESPMTRLETVHKKYTELLADMKKLDRDYSKSKKRADQLQKDQDKGKSELNKTVTMKDKLEKLCRELTKENKKVKDENKKLEETEKKARLIVNERLDSLLYDIQDVMAAKGNPRSEKADIDLDEALRAKIKTIGEKFEMRELHYKALLRSKDAEIQCLTAKYEEQRRTAENEAARCRALSSQVSTFSHTEAELRSQLNIYVEKFKQVEDTLNNSNELFLTFRKEMEEMSWYTTMLGKLSSVSVLIETLLEHKNNNYAVTEFVQGNKTRRWAISWSWTDLRPTVSIARGTTAIPKHLLPFPSEYIFTTQSESIDEVSAKIDSELSALHVQWLWRKNLATGVGFAMQNVWSRQARRKMQNPDAMAEMGEIDETKAALGFKVQCKKDAIDEKGVRVIVRWLKGRDTVLFESFCGMLKRKVESNQ